MPAVASGVVLVTGASGFLGAHLCRAFLARGYDVRGSVRSPDKGEYLRNMFAAMNLTGNKCHVSNFNQSFMSALAGKFTYVLVKDIAEPGAFDEAVQGVDAIAHAASPFLYLPPDADPDVLLKPAVQGTTGILNSTKQYGTSVRRVVVTSSVAAVATMGQKYDGPHVFTSNDWNEKSVQEVKTKGIKAAAGMKYGASKVLAERALWEFVANNKSSISFDAVATNTPYLYGPVIHEVASFDKVNTSTKVLYGLLADPLPENLDELGEWQDDHLDVRDLAEAQVDAVAREELSGHRLILAGGPVTRQDFLDAAHALGNELPKLPFEVPLGRPGLGNVKRDTFVRFSDESQKLLGWKLRQLPEIIKDTLQSLNERGLI